jgi:hypothetical protein
MRFDPLFSQKLAAVRDVAGLVTSPRGRSS